MISTPPWMSGAKQLLRTFPFLFGVGTTCIITLMYYTLFPRKLFGKVAKLDGTFLHQLVADECPATLLTPGRLFFFSLCLTNFV